MKKQILIVGGGTAGWLTAGYLARTLGAQEQSGLDLLPYWLLDAAGESEWSQVNTPQKAAADDGRAPKLITHPDYVAPLNYAYHFDAAKLAGVLRNAATGLGVRHVVDTIDEVLLAEDGAIAAVRGRASGLMTADLYVNCTGFRAQLIGQALKSPYKSCRPVLFCDSALAMQVPYERPGQGIHPDSYDPLVDSLPEDEARRFVRHVRDMIGKTAQAMPPHAKFLEGLAAAPAPAGMVVGRPGSTAQAAS